MTGEEKVGPPVPNFTIEELLRKAVEATPEGEPSVFTTRELARLWGYTMQRSARRRMDKLEEDRGWKFVATRKSIVNRAGSLTTAPAYEAIPPQG